jgi:hypothetical protein
MKSLAVAFAALLLLPAGALAKSGISLDSRPDGLAVGQSWDVGIEAIRADMPVDLRRVADPGIVIEKPSSGETHRFSAERRAGGKYYARVVFPSSGTWSYRVTGLGLLGAHQEWDPVEIAPAVTSGSSGVAGSSRGGGGGFPFGWIAAATPFAVALGIFLVRRRSPGSGPEPQP